MYYGDEYKMSLLIIALFLIATLVAWSIPEGVMQGQRHDVINPPMPRVGREMVFRSMSRRLGIHGTGSYTYDYLPHAIQNTPVYQNYDHHPYVLELTSATSEPPAIHHPLGQTMIVMAGCGLVQRWGGPVGEIRPSDVVWFPPGEMRIYVSITISILSYLF
jgi:hypothetical protein